MRISLILMLLVFTSSLKAQNTMTVVERGKALAVYGRALWRPSPESIAVRGVGVASKTIRQENTNTIRIHFNVQGTFQPGTWAVRILNSSGNVVWTYSSAGESKLQFWSKEIRGNEVKVEVLSTHEENQINVIIDSVAITEVPSVPLSITPPGDQMIKINDEPIQDRRNWGKAVTRLRFVGDDRKLYVCTGFLITSNLLMTNEHCPQTENEWRSTLVDFDFDEADAEPTNINQFKELVISDRKLDFAIFRLKFTAKNRLPLVLDSTVPQFPKELLLIQHPGGKSKRISVIDCKIIPPPAGFPSSPFDFVHLCDTEGGSSGGSVIDKTTGKVIGLHHLGWDTTQVPLPPPDKQVNQAILMRDIINFIKANRPDIATEIGIQ